MSLLFASELVSILIPIYTSPTNRDSLDEKILDLINYINIKFKGL